MKKTKKKPAKKRAPKLPRRFLCEYDPVVNGLRKSQHLLYQQLALLREEIVKDNELLLSTLVAKIDSLSVPVCETRNAVMTVKDRLRHFVHTLAD